MRTRIAAFALLLVLRFVASAHATPIIIGSSSPGNAFPFGVPAGAANAYLGEYQQIYAATAFGGPLTISEIAFASLPGAGLATSISDAVVLGLGTTSATPAAPSTNYAANKRADFQQVFSGTITAALAHNGTFDFIIPLTTPFAYNPADGNLLLDVFVVSETSTPAARTTSFAAGPSTDIGRVFNLGGTGAPTRVGNEGLLTSFSTTTAVPDTSGPRP